MHLVLEDGPTSPTKSKPFKTYLLVLVLVVSVTLDIYGQGL
jgi:hypothetical protein